MYLKPRRERVRCRAQRIRSPGSSSPEEPPPREAREPLSARAEFLFLPAPPGKGSPELGRGRGRLGRRGRGRGRPGRRAPTRAGTRRDERARGGGGAELSPEAGAAAQRICRRGARCTRGAAPRSCSPAAAPRPAAHRGGSERLPPPPGTYWRGESSRLRFSRNPPPPPERDRPASSRAPASGAHGFMKTLMQEVGRTGANFSAGSASAAPRASSPSPSSPGGRRCPRWWRDCWGAAAAAGPAGGPCRAPGCA